MTRALLVLNTDSDRDTACRWARGIPLGSRIEFKETKRTLPQNDLMWALLTEVSQQLQHGGRRYDAEQWKSIFLHAFGREITFLPSLDMKTFLPIELSSSDLGKDEMTNFIEFIIKEGTERGVVFRDKDIKASDAAPSLAGSDEGGAEPSPADAPPEEPAGTTPSPAPAGSVIPEKELEVLKRFAKSTLSLAAKPDTSGETMTKVVNRWINIDLVNVQSEAGRAAVKSIHGSVKAIMKGDVDPTIATEFHAEMLGCEPSELMTEVEGND